MWNQFDKNRDKLNQFDNPNFEPGSGIEDREEILDAVYNIYETTKGDPHPIVKSKAIAYVLDNAAIEVNPLDWFGFNIAGWITSRKANITVKMSDEQTKISNADKKRKNYSHTLTKPLGMLPDLWSEELDRPEEFMKAAENITETGAGQFWIDYEHSVPDWDSVINLGFAGILKRAQKFHQEKIDNGTITPEQEIYYTSVEMAYEAIMRLMNRFHDCAKKHINDDPKMPVVAESIGQLCVGAPQTFHQFLLAVYLYHLIQDHIDIIQVRSLGNLDVDGYPFYKKDVENGFLDRDKAEELVRFFFEKYTHMGHLYGQPAYFGGFDENGDSLINELSYIMIDAHERSGLVNPKLFVKVMPNTPDDFLKKVLDMIRRGKNCVVFVNEQLGVDIGKKLGRTEAETNRLVATGCNNLASRGNETVPEHMYVNIAKAVELVFNNGVDPISGHKIGCDTGDVSEFKTFEDFKAAYIKQAECLIDKAFVISDFCDSHLLDINPSPIYSGCMPHSVECGRDAYYNGSKYNNTVMFLSCHATVGDSLYMVKKHVYDNKDLSIEKLRDALLANWQGYEDIQQMMLDDTDKFGNDIDDVDYLLTGILDHLTNKVTSRKNMRGGQFVVNGESITFSHRWKDMCGATPDGRARGDLLSKNMSATIGQDRKGITAHIKSVTKIDASNFAYGCPFDYMLHPSAVKGDDGLNCMLGLLRTFMKRGGYGFQGNVQDAKVLKDAKINPDKHSNLQVRVAGWSWYFTKMEDYYQDEFIKRAELEELHG